MSNSQRFDFVFYGGSACLDFFNTVRRRKDPLTPTQDLLMQEDGFRTWILKAEKQAQWTKSYPSFNLVTINSQVTEDFMEKAIQLRSAIGGFISNNFSQRDVEIVNQLARLRPSWQLSIDIDEGAFVSKDNIDLYGVLGIIAEDCIQLFTSDLSNNIKECAQERCGLVFLDKSNGSKRNWCSMKSCGNRAKASRFVEKHGKKDV